MSDSVCANRRTVKLIENTDMSMCLPGHDNDEAVSWMGDEELSNRESKIFRHKGPKYGLPLQPYEASRLHHESGCLESAGTCSVSGRSTTSCGKTAAAQDRYCPGDLR